MSEKVKYWWSWCGGEKIFEGVVAIVIAIALVAGLFLGTAYGMLRPACYAETAEIGFESRWSFWGGCQIEVEPDHWIPLDNWYWAEERPVE